MEISLIISGNLTGFSRFYASPNANDVYNEAKFDFDYRNFLTFLNAGEKAYAISFSPKIIAVSLITRILDSFRRPGILVITALVPRYQLVRGQLNQNDKTAIFKLLNEINDKFYEKNFLNGMVNQNPAVLMQDYYSDILSRYVFVNDRMQKPVNSRIDVTSPNKRIGYVAAAEGSMPQYLSSVMRKSYEGYHHVFLSPHAPQNIDEPAEEILTYKVRIENGNRPVPGEVRLTDRIPNINPEQGEKDIPNKNFTYGQVISGEAGTDIIGTIENGETIVLNYRFPQEEKTVYFRFYDGANEVPMTLIRPYIVDSNGATFNIPSDSYTFYGKEIYGRKTIKSGNSEYSIVGPAANLDLQRVQNGATININVERGWVWQFAPMRNNQPATVKPVNITLTNRFNGDRRSFTNVTSAISEKLSGNPSEWEMVIESDYYKDVRVPVNSPYRLDPKPIQQYPNSPAGNGGRNVNPSHRTKSTGQNNQGLRISTGDQHTAKDSEQIRRERNKRYMIYGVAVALLCLVTVGCFWWFNNKKKSSEETPKSDILTEKIVTFDIFDSDGNAISSVSQKDLELSIQPMECIRDTTSQYTKIVLPSGLQEQTIIVELIHTPSKVVIYSKEYTVSDLNPTEKLSLPLTASEIGLYKEIDNARSVANGKVLESQISSYKERNSVIEKKNPDFAYAITNLISSLTTIENPVEQKEDGRKIVAEPEKPKPENKIDWSILDKVEVTSGDISSLESEAEQYKIRIPRQTQTRITALKGMINALKSGGRPSINGLSNAQAKEIKRLFKGEGREAEIKKMAEDNSRLFNKVDGLTRFKALVE